jgi:hypothetical protein
MTDNPTFSPRRQLEDYDAALRPKSLAEFVGIGGSASWNACRKDIYQSHG